MVEKIKLPIRLSSWMDIYYCHVNINYIDYYTMKKLDLINIKSSIELIIKNLIYILWLLWDDCKDKLNKI